MRKVLTIGIITFLVVAGATWCVSWYLQASRTQDTVENWITYVNSGQELLTYDKIESSGFPNDVKIVLTNPRFSGRMDELLKHLDKKNELGLTDIPEWTEDLSINGTVSLTVNSFSDEYKIDMNGIWTQHSDMNGKAIARLQTTGPMSTACALAMNKGTFLNNMWSLKLFDDAKSFFKEFRSLNCAAGAYSMVDQATQSTYTSGGPTQMFVSKEKADDAYKVRFMMKYEDALITEDGEKLIQQYVQEFWKDSFYPYNYAVYGKQSGEIDFVYNGPSLDAGNITYKPFEFNLSKLVLKNALYSGDGHLLLKHENTTDGMSESVLNTRFEFDYTPEYDAMLEYFVWSFIDHVEKTKNPEFRELRRSFAGRSGREVYTIIKPVIPNPSSLGTWVQSVNLSYKGQKDYSTGSVNLAGFAFTMTSYGITGSGTASKEAGNPFPNADMKFQCAACSHMIDDATTYTNKVLRVLQTFNPENPSYSYQISSHLVYGIKNFLSEISSAEIAENNKGNYVFAITSDPSGNMMVSGKGIMEIMQLYEKHIARHIMSNAQQPAEGEIPSQGWKVE